MAEHIALFRLSSMCRVLRVQRSGYYAWKAKPKSKRTLANESLLVKIKKSFEESQSIYGSPRVHCDLREEGVLQSAKLHGHDPWAYLKDVLSRLPGQMNSRIDELLPHRWQPQP